MTAPTIQSTEYALGYGPTDPLVITSTYTFLADDIIFISIGTDSGPYCTGITSPGLTFSLLGHMFSQTVYAATVGGTIVNPIFTCQLSSNSYNDVTAIIVQARGATSGTPYDPNPSLPAITGGGTPAAAIYSTSLPNDLVLFFIGATVGKFQAQPWADPVIFGDSVDNGFSWAIGVNNSGGFGAVSEAVYYKITSGLLVNDTASSSAVVSGGVYLVVALTGDVVVPPPGIPTSLSCGANSVSSITPTWIAGSGGTPDTYTLQYRAVGDVSWTQIIGITSTSQTITGLALGTSYEWQVEAINSAGNSGFSSTSTCDTLAVAPWPPPSFGPIPIAGFTGLGPPFPGIPEGFPVRLSIVMDTTIGTTKSLREVRVANQQLPLWDIEIPFQELRDETQNQLPYEPFVYPVVYQQYEELCQLWLMMYGQTGIFAFDAPWDNSREDQLIGIGDGETYIFTVVRTWGTGLTATTVPVGLINTITNVKVDGADVSSSHYLTDRNKIYFRDLSGNLYPPGDGLDITMTFSFYYLCRFVEDEQDFEEFSKNRWTVPSLKFRAVIWP